MSDQPLAKDEAKTKLNQCFEDGTVIYSKHFRDELANDDLTREDVHAVCRCGAIVTAPEKERYQKRTMEIQD